jgi:hypothetical protein
MSDKVVKTSDQVVESLDEDIDEYLAVAFAGTKTGFSKGTADVSPSDLKKLRPLVKFYAKKAKPFTACVNDNRKRFGPLTEKYCAIIKDLIVGNTKWRNQGNKKNLSDSTLKELFGLSVDEGFFTFLSELTEEEVQEMIAEDTESEETNDMTALAEEVDYNDDPTLLAEMYFADEEAERDPDSDGYIWKPILREGTWKMSPGPGQQAVPKPITVVKSGKSDRENMVISMAELKKNFENGVVEHVTIPTSHNDSVLENTGFVKALRISKDADGRAVLEAAHDFRDVAVKEKALSGTVANTSAGILFDYIHKETGKKFRSVLAHVALTNRPWLNGMKPFGVNASEEIDDLEIVGFAEESINPAEPEEVEEVSETTLDFSEFGFSSADELKAALAERETLRAASHERDVADRCAKWQEEGKAPALVTAAKDIMMSDKGGNVLNLSEGGKEVALSASDIVERLVSAAPGVVLSEDPVTEEQTSQEQPATEEEPEVKLSQEESRLATNYWLNEGLSQEAAIARAKAEVSKQNESK